MNKNLLHKWLSVGLSFALVFSNFNFTVYAEDEEETVDELETVAEQVAMEETTEEYIPEEDVYEGPVYEEIITEEPTEVELVPEEETVEEEIVTEEIVEEVTEEFEDVEKETVTDVEETEDEEELVVEIDETTEEVEETMIEDHCAVFGGIYVDETGTVIDEAYNTVLTFEDEFSVMDAVKDINDYEFVSATIDGTEVVALENRMLETEEVPEIVSLYVCADETEVQVSGYVEITFTYAKNEYITALNATVVDTEGNLISDNYANVVLPDFEDTLAVENVLGTIRKDRGLHKGYNTYEYVGATLNGNPVIAIHKEEKENGTSYFYTSDGSRFEPIREDATIVLVYANSEQKITYEYEDCNVKVTAQLTDASAIPDDAEFIVTSVTENTAGYDYDAYMTALNNANENEYNNENTLLYDVAFYANELDNDGNLIEGSKVEIQPANGSVNITFIFKQNQLEEGNITVNHLSLSDAVRNTVDTTADATYLSVNDIYVENVNASITDENANFELSSFSLIAFNANNDVNVMVTGPDGEYYLALFDQWNNAKSNVVIVNVSGGVGTGVLKPYDSTEAEVKFLYLAGSGDKTRYDGNYYEIMDNFVNTGAGSFKVDITTTDDGIVAALNPAGNRATSAGEIKEDLGITTKFMIVADHFRQDQHYEGNLAVNNFEVASSQATGISTNRKQTNLIVTINKTTSPAVSKTFQFVIVDNKDNTVVTLPVTTDESGIGSVSYRLNDTISSYTVYELDADGNRMNNGETDGTFTVSYEGNFIPNYDVTSFAKHITGTDNIEFNLATTLVTTSTNFHDYSRRGTLMYVTEDEFDKLIDINSLLNNAEALSYKLANAITTDTVAVFNFAGNTMPHLNGDRVYLPAIGAEQALVLNVVIPRGTTEFRVGDGINEIRVGDQILMINGYYKDAYLARRTIWNYIYDDGSLYDGTVVITKAMDGTHLVPKGNVIAGYSSPIVSIIANSVSQAGGEIHEMNFMDPEDVYTTVSVKNSSQPAPEKSGKLQLTKLFAGEEVTDEEKSAIEFQILDKENNEIATVKYSDLEPDASGEIVWKVDDIDPGAYTIKEKNADVDGLVLKTIYSDGSDGNFEIIDGDEIDCTLTNFYSLEGEVQFNAKKELFGTQLTENQFNFRLTETDIDGTPIVAGYSEELGNDADGTVAFTPISYGEDGTHYYKLEEVIPADTADMIYDDAYYFITVKVEESDDQEFNVSTTYEIITGNTSKTVDADDIVFYNTAVKYYSMDAGFATINGTKALMRGTDTVPFEAGQFVFELSETEDFDTIVSTASADANGNYTFHVSYPLSQKSSKTYFVREVHGGQTLDGIAYDETVKTVTVSDGTGMVEPFVNQTTVAVSVEKIWDNTKNPAGDETPEITVVLKAYTDGQTTGTEVSKTKLNTTTGWKYTFDNLPAIDETGKELIYTVEELVDEDWKYNVDVSGTVSEDGKTYQFTIVNEYDPGSNVYIEPQALKTYTNDGSPIEMFEGEFTFNMYKYDANAMNHRGQFVAKAYNAVDGKVIFPFMSYTKTGTYEYIIEEAAGNNTHIVYDSTQYKLTVEVTKDTATSALSATETYTSLESGAVVEIPEFENTYHDFVVRVQKTSREAPFDPLPGSVYGIWLVNENGGQDAYIGHDTSGADGYMYFTDCIVGMKYYFKEEAAPKEHIVDFYPSTVFSVEQNEDGTYYLAYHYDVEVHPVAPETASSGMGGAGRGNAKLKSAKVSAKSLILREENNDDNGTQILTFKDTRDGNPNAGGVSDPIVTVDFAKVDENHNYVEGAVMQIIEKETGKKVYEWTTKKSVLTLNRTSVGTGLDVNTAYILHEVSAPEGFKKINDVEFSFTLDGKLVFSDTDEVKADLGSNLLTIYDVWVGAENVVYKETVLPAKKYEYVYHESPLTSDNRPVLLVGMLVLICGLFIAYLQLCKITSKKNKK